MSKSPLVSVIIPTINEEKVIERLIISIEKQTYKNLEYIVVDNKSTDQTATIARKYTNKVYIRGPQRSAQRNFGAKMSKGKYLFFLDADMELSPNVVKECVQLMYKDQTLGGIIVPEKSVAINYWEKVKAFERSFYNQVEGDHVTDAARFIRRDIFEEVGGYDEKITGPEDWDLPEVIQRAGYNMGRIKSRIFHYERIPTLYSLVKKKYFYALKSYKYLKKQGIPLISPKTIYFLRPVFYKNWRKVVSHPILSIGLVTMFTFEQLAGGIGLIIGMIKKI